MGLSAFVNQMATSRINAVVSGSLKKVSFMLKIACSIAFQRFDGQRYHVQVLYEWDHLHQRSCDNHR